MLAVQKMMKETKAKMTSRKIYKINQFMKNNSWQEKQKKQHEPDLK